MTLELLLLLDRFNALVNPLNKKCYIKKTRGKGNHDRVLEGMVSFDEMMFFLKEDPSLSYGIDLSQLGLFFIDYDGESPWVLERVLSGLEYVKIKTLKNNHAHYYLRVSEHVRPGFLENDMGTIYDYYRPGAVNPYCPVIPTNNEREFVTIPKKIDVLPEGILSIKTKKDLI